jgi:hypothetical protein
MLPQYVAVQSRCEFRISADQPQQTLGRIQMSRPSCGAISSSCVREAARSDMTHLGSARREKSAHAELPVITGAFRR